MQEQQSLVAPDQEKYFLETFPLIQRVAAHRLSVYCQHTVEDITQKVMLKLWSWKTSRTERDLSQEEWQRLANTTTQNEIKRFYAGKSRKEVSLSEISENINYGRLTDGLIRSEIEGNTESELHSLLTQMWKSILNQSLRERYALLLKSRELLNRLFAHKCCNIKEAADALRLTKEEFIEIYRNLPLSDADIAVCLERKLQEPITSENVLKARQRAKAKIRNNLEQTKLNGKPSVPGKT